MKINLIDKLINKIRDFYFEKSLYKLFSNNNQKAKEWLKDKIRKEPTEVKNYKRLDKMMTKKEKEDILGEYDFESINSFCMFVGCGRSGHSLIGSLLDAHQNLIIAHEFDVLGNLDKVSLKELYKFLRYNSYIYGQKGRNWTGYNYTIKDQLQGKVNDKLLVLGDKKGGGTSLHLSRNPQLLDSLKARLSVPIRFINILRNPFDNITTLCMRSGMTLEEAIDNYFTKMKATKKLRDSCDGDKFTIVYLEEFIENPEYYLEKILRNLNISNISDNYLESCSNIVNDEPSRSRKKLEWDDKLIKKVEKNCKLYPPLMKYIQ